MLYGKNARNGPALALFIVLLMMFSIGGPTVMFNPAPESPTELSDEGVTYRAAGGEQTYELYIDSPDSELGGQGSITTIEPTGGQEEGSAISGLEFRSAEMISNLYVNGTGSSNTARLSAYMQFRGADGSSADVTFSLKSGDSQIASESRSLDNPCSSTSPFGGGCSWTVIEVEFDIGSDGFVVEQGKQLKIRIDADASCEGNTGGIGQADCAVDIAFGKMDSSGGFSRLQIMTNALSDSSVKVHSCQVDFGCGWLDDEKLQWSPNHRPEFREMQFSIEVRDAFGREDIEEVNLILNKPSGAGAVVFENEFDDNDLKLDNNGLVGTYNYTYDLGTLSAGEYPLRLEVEDVQGHSVVFEHPGIEFLEHDVYLTLPASQPDIMLIAPGQTSAVTFLVEHTGSTSSNLEVVFDLSRDLPSSWSDPQWSSNTFYTLSGGGDSAIAELLIEVPDADLSTAPSRLEVEARVYATNNDDQREEVAIKSIELDIEEVGVYAPPRISIYEDDEHQKQIADSTRPEAYDETLSHYVDAEEVGSFYIDVFNSGFDTDAFKIRILEQPDDWQYRFYDNVTGMELDPDGIYSITPDIGSTQILTVRMEVYPPADRDGVDIGLFSLAISSQEDSELRTDVAFTVHRTFGILVEVISDSDGVGDGNLLGQVGPVSPGSSVWYSLRITDSSSSGGGQTKWRIINPADVKRNADANPKYTSWDYTISNGTNDNIVVVNLASDEYVDLRLDIELRDEVEAGDHTIYTRIIEEGVDSDDARYFDLPVKVNIKEDVVPGRLEIVPKSEASRFAPGEDKNIEYRITNQNNIPLDVVITLDQPEGWDGVIRATSNQLGSNFLLLSLPAYSSKNFSVRMTAPDALKNSAEVDFKLEVTPMNEETPYGSEYIQKFSFAYMTECGGVSCLFTELVNPEPQTMVFYVFLAVLLMYYVRNRSPRESYDYGEKFVEFEGELEGEELATDDDDLPPPVVAEDDDDDDLELLDELEDL